MAMENIDELISVWKRLDSLAHVAITPIENEEHLKKATDYLYSLTKEIGDAEDHPLGSLAQILIDRITNYEAKHYPIPDIYGAEYLEFLLEKHDISQYQLAQETGIHQSTISNLISGKREINTRHICIFANHFKVSPENFLPLEMLKD